MKAAFTPFPATRAVASVALVALLSIGSTRASADDRSMQFAWAQQGDVAACLSSGPASDPCARVRWTYYIWPNIVRELGRVSGGTRPPTGPLDPATAPWGRFTAVAFPSGRLGGFLPNPEDDDDLGPIGPVARESLVLNQVLLAELAGQTQGANAIARSLFERDAMMRDLRVTRGALQAALNDVDKQLEALQKPRRR
jgi:hypothetical protein